MKKFVVDANIVLEWIPSVLKKDSPANIVREALVDKKMKLFAPEFLLLEVSNVLFWKKVYNALEVKNFINWLRGVGISFVDVNTREVADVVNMIYKYEITSYDALYIYLAKKTGCKLLTADRKLLEIKNLTIGLDEFLNKH